MNSKPDRKFPALLSTIVSALYIINPTAGLIEFIPDNLPLIGNLDEFLASMIIIISLRYLGLDLSRLPGGRNKHLPKIK